MLRIEAPEEMNWHGYGVTLVPGVNTLDFEIPYGLMRSFERHHDAGKLKIQGRPAPSAQPQPTVEPQRQQAQQHNPGKNKPKWR